MKKHEEYPNGSRSLVSYCFKHCGDLDSSFLAAEACAIAEIAGQTIGTGKDAEDAEMIASDTIENLLVRSGNFYQHPVSFRPLTNTKNMHHEWLQSKLAEGCPVPTGVTASCNPFLTQYLVDVCGYSEHDATEKLIDIFITNPQTFALPELLGSTCLPGNKEKATELVSNWWEVLEKDKLDSAQIIRTLCNEQRRNPDGTKLVSEIALELLMKDSEAAIKFEKILETPPPENASSNDVLKWVEEAGRLKGMRQAYKQLAEDID